MVLRCVSGRNSYGSFKEEESSEKQVNGEKMCSCFRHPLFQLSRMKNLRHRTIIIITYFLVRMLLLLILVFVKVKNPRSEFVSPVRLGLDTMRVFSC